MLAPPCKRHHRRWRKRCAVSAVTALADVTPCARTEHLLSLYDHVTRPKLCLECDSQATYTKFSAISYQGVLNISPPSISVAQWFSLPGYTTVSADTAPYLRLPTSQQSRLIRHLTCAYLSSWLYEVKQRYHIPGTSTLDLCHHKGVELFLNSSL